MTVIYSLSTAPFFAKNPDSVFEIDKFELYTAALSSLVRRRAGNITIMHTDRRGQLFFEQKGLLSLWDDVRITLPLDLGGINPKMFWAAGKLFALESSDCPVLMLDTDFIAWDLPELDDSIVAAHREELAEHIYPPISSFKMRDGYVFDSVNYSPRPLNTAFLYMPDTGFKDFYVEKSLNFMRCALDCDDHLTYMVYAEQRLLAILAEHKGVKVRELFRHPLDGLCSHRAELRRLPPDLECVHVQQSYTHTWGAKQVMRDIPAECERFCEKCRTRIRKDFPEWEWIISKIEKEITRT
jgi:hypothetical protein